MVLTRYTGKREDQFSVVGRVTGNLYKIEGPGLLIEVDLRDWPGFQKQFFEAVTLVQPEQIKETAKPPRRTVVIDPADGIDDAEAVEAAGVLAQYRAEKLGKKLDRIVPIESTDWKDYYEAASDDDED